jgi:hypothetical protein
LFFVNKVGVIHLSIVANKTHECYWENRIPPPRTTAAAAATTTTKTTTITTTTITTRKHYYDACETDKIYHELVMYPASPG